MIGDNFLYYVLINSRVIDQTFPFLGLTGQATITIT